MSDRRRGLSLIEVLVAIAILTVGILAILILFPAGLSTLQTAAEFTNADRLAQAELEKADASQNQLIVGIYANDMADSPANDGINPASLINGTQLTQNSGSDVDGYRFIQGETVRVPAPTDLTQPGQAQATPTSIYTVIASPVEANTVMIYGEPWKGTSSDSSTSQADVNSGSVTDLPAGQPQYLIDYANGEILLAAEAPNATLYDENIQFTVTDSTGATTTQSLTVPKAAVGTWVKLSSIYQEGSTTVYGNQPQVPWVTGSDRLVRNFDYIGTTPGTLAAWTSDPYQWQFYTPNYAASSPTPGNLGVIAFNPAGGTVIGSNGKPLEAMINYATYDWHIISEDRQVNSALGSVKLSLISWLSETAGDKLSDNKTSYTGLFTYSGASASATDNPDVIILDMDTGIPLTAGSDYSVNYPGGTVAFINANGEYVNHHLRIYYHAAKDWAVALERAPLIYSADPAGYSATSTTPTGLAEYTVNGEKIYFPIADAGKQVDIRITYASTNGSATETSTLDGLYTINAISASEANVDMSNFITPDPGYTVTSITPVSIKGGSLGATVLWRENGIWRNRIISTVVPPQTSAPSTVLQ